MSLGSFEYFLVFLPVVVCGYWAVCRRAPRLGILWLIAASGVFYCWAGASGLPYLITTALFNCWIGLRISSTTVARRKAQLLKVGLCANAAQLLILKYSGFFLGLFGVAEHSVRGPLPMGISFYTLIQIMYLLDCSEGLTNAHGVAEHLLFSSFFPYVALGPLVRARDMKPLLTPSGPPQLGESDAGRGVELFVFGLFKKTVLAQSCAHLADSGWSLARPSLIEAWVGTLAFTFELYFDFGGYTDMALGTAQLFGVRLPKNFEDPYKATSIIGFWRRWHISLSAFITTYLYTPLLRLRRRPTFAYAMLMTVVAMTIAGLWHGASWTFITFGLLHGLALVTNNLWRKTKRHFPAPLGWLLTFSFVVLTLVLFRAGTLTSARNMFASMLGFHGLTSFDSDLFIGSGPGAVRAVVAVGAVALCFFAPTSHELSTRFSPSLKRAVAIAIIALVASVFMNSLAAKEFIYRDF